MRSVFVFPRRDRADVVALLDGMSPSQRQPWLVDEVLHVELASEDDQLYVDWEPEMVDMVAGAIGRRPGWAVTIDVSGRVDGTEEVRRLVLALLDGDGVAVDDYSDHVWTKVEIESGARYDGLSFFDFRGAHERR